MAKHKQKALPLNTILTMTFVLSGIAAIFVVIGILLSANSFTQADARGWFTKRPSSTVCADIYSPVCGTDGKTYSNECVAKRAGVSVAKQGACGSERPSRVPVSY